MQLNSSRLSILPEVSQALDSGRPVVALESTIIAHGLPYPANVDTARQLETVIRQEGATPATLGIIAGRLCIGLDEPSLQLMAKSSDVQKVSRRDLPLVMARRQHGATTVAATMILAHRAGIRIFATGGIGGVHRGAETSMDISADLEELARTPVAVVCAGAKSILDLPLTLEYLETRGVPVVGFGCDAFPAFFRRDSGLPVDARVDSVDELAEILHLKWQMDLDGGVVVANPISAEASLEGEEIEEQIERALQEARDQTIQGKALTPFVLDRVQRLSQGRSLQANVALVVSNARLAARLAVALAAISDPTSPPADDVDTR